MINQELIAFLGGIAVMVPHADEEAMQIDVVDPNENAVYCTGEETGEQYYISLDELNVDDYMFYKLQLVEPPK